MAGGFISSIDAFRRVPKDLSEASTTGAVMTVFAIVTCTVLFFCEMTAFLTARPRTDIVLDSNQDSLLKINFDVHMLDMTCDHVTVGVWDAFGSERMNITKNIQKQRIDHKGQDKGHAYSEDELVELEFSDKSFTKDELAELDADWSSSSDQFKHDNFQSVIDAHDFTFVNFYADWCPHCRMFANTWGEFEKKVNSGEDAITDADNVKANVRILKINCVDFEETCQEQRVSAFPTIRLYRRGAKEKSWTDFNGRREIGDLSRFAHTEVKKRHMHTGAQYHEMFTEGCRISGSIEVARVPGTVHFQAMHTEEKTLNLAFTNVSHHVHKFNFGDNAEKTAHALPSEYRRHVNPLDGKTFTVPKFHMAPHHFVKVVHTRFEASALRSYQLTHQWNVRAIQRKTIPQAKFSYDLSPVEVVVRKGDRRWYDFVTSIFAIVGGSFTFMSMASGVLNFASAQFKASINKLG
jgi:thiol-disulfide isomerase/thioredoxin